MNTKDYAKRIGVKQPLVSRWIRDGILKKSIKKKGRFYEINVKIADQELKKNRDPVRGGDRTGKKRPQGRKKKKDSIDDDRQKTSDKAGTGGIDFSTARALNEQYKAALKKMQYEREHGLLVRASEIKRVAFETGKHIKEQCLAIPVRCAALVAACSDEFECKRILTEEITHILENLADELAAVK